jgi:hypothetical protein
MKGIALWGNICILVLPALHTSKCKQLVIIKGDYVSGLTELFKWQRISTAGYEYWCFISLG